MTKINKIVMCILFFYLLIIFFLTYSVYRIDKITYQCQRSYDMYAEYVDDLNKIAEDDGLETKEKVSIYEFCSN